jgi:hypothetical protein
MKRVMRNKKVIAMMVVVLVAVLLTTGGVVAGDPTGSGDPPVESKINYQGQLTDNGGNPLDGTYNMQFLFYDSAAGGSQVGSTISENDVGVTNGLFNVKLDVNQSDFNGQGLWLEVMVEGETLSPRQEILPVPYALSLKPGARILGTVDNGPALYVRNDGSGSTAVGLWATSVNAAGVYGESTNGIGLSGVGHDNSIGTQGYNSGSGVGVSAYSASGAAISASGTGVIESTADSYIFISGNDFVRNVNTDTTRWDCQENGAARIWRGATPGDKAIYLPITVPGVLYGQEVTVEELTIYYKCQDGTQNYISTTRLYKQTAVDSFDVIVLDETDRKGTTAASYTLTPTANNVLSASQGILGLWLRLHFEDDVRYIQFGGARVRLGHAS